ncbi:hypothetical protein BZG36_04451 [Bifiguratus adelaidae]|uniref:procollagen-lysine 5-dioxygenase n=1 Tax=Bifiguratus adelaidae TaxID=1938954 RepID=A0A261XVD4_9FUNG|nr:hypothetical protein BZG36_04451 [Bifiguratus adelaidae]
MPSEDKRNAATVETRDKGVSERPVKRTKIEKTQPDVVSNNIAACFHQGLLDSDYRADLAKKYAASKPYLHCKIEKLINDDLLRKVRTEIIENLHFSLKETDIYKVHQTGDLANLDGLSREELDKLSNLFRLRNALYSKDFRQFLSDVTGCGPLSGKNMDMSINTYAEGCHLICHDDVIGTRRVSFILYLPDPEQPWLPEYGGALELYPVEKKGTPSNIPSVIIPPAWNQFVMFTVQPGHSFHTVAEVVPEGKPRLSISGWFHFPMEGEEGYVKDRVLDQEAAPSSLQQLSEKDTIDSFIEYATPPEEEALEGLTEEDLHALGEFLNPKYLDFATLRQISETFVDQSSIQIEDFLNKTVYDEVVKATLEADKEDGFLEVKLPAHDTGIRGDWHICGPPHRQRFMELIASGVTTGPESASPVSQDLTSALFSSFQRALFNTQAFRNWLSLVTQCTLRAYRGRARRFRPGLDYTLATSNTRGQVLLDVTLCLATNGKIQKDNGKATKELWSSDEAGGYECYMAPHDEEEDAAVYKSGGDDGALLTASAGSNVLTMPRRTTQAVASYVDTDPHPEWREREIIKRGRFRQNDIWHTKNTMPATHSTEEDPSTAAHLLFLVLVWDETSWGRDKGVTYSIDTYLNMILNTGYPTAKISFGFLVGNLNHFYTVRRTVVDFVKQHNIHKASILWKQENEADIIDRKQRHEHTLQRQRRRNLGKLRTYLQTSVFDVEDAVVWMDADVVEMPEGIIQKMVGSGKDIITSRCTRGHNPDYDLNAWQGPRRIPTPEGLEKFKEGKGFSFGPTNDTLHMKDFMTQPRTMQNPNPTKAPEFVPLTSVGGTILYMMGDAVREGVNFPGYFAVGTHWDTKEGWDGVETEGTCYIARALNYECWGMPDVAVRHSLF